MTRIHTIPIVYYHSVGPVVSNWHRHFLTLNPQAFSKHLEYFSRNYNIISLKELWQIRTGQSAPVRKPLVITFDDGYSDNFTWAFPLLKRYTIKATIFVSPAFVADCLETTIEIGHEYKDLFIKAGGENLTLVPSLNADAEWASLITGMAKSPDHNSISWLAHASVAHILQ